MKVTFIELKQFSCQLIELTNPYLSWMGGETEEIDELSDLTREKTLMLA